MSSTFLRIKIKSLLAEGEIIRKEAARVRNPDLHQRLLVHRWSILGDPMRSTLLAYGFVRGKTWEQMESPHTRNHPNYAEVVRMVRQYGSFGPDEIAALESKLRDIQGIVTVNRRKISEPRVKHPHLPGTKRPALAS